MVNIHKLDPEHPQDERVDELPFGTRGGIAVRSEFPVDGTYIVKVDVGNAQGHELEITVDGERAALRALGGGRGGPAVDAPPGQPDPADPDPTPPSNARPAVAGRGDTAPARWSGAAGAAGAAGARVLQGATRRRRRGGRVQAARRWSPCRAARVPADAEGRTEADWRRVRAAHRRARRIDAAAAHAQPRHAAGDQQRHDQRPLQRHGPRRFTEPAAHLCLPSRLRS